MGSSPELRLPGRASAADHSHMHGLHQQALQHLVAGYGGQGVAQGLLGSPRQHRGRPSLGSVHSTGSEGHESAGEGSGHCLLVQVAGVSCHGSRSCLSACMLLLYPLFACPSLITSQFMLQLSATLIGTMCRCLMTARTRPEWLAHSPFLSCREVFLSLCDGWGLQVLPWGRTETACFPPCCSSAQHQPAVIRLRTAPLGGSCPTGKLICGSSVCAGPFTLHPLLHTRHGLWRNALAVHQLHAHLRVHSASLPCACVTCLFQRTLAAMSCRLPGSWVDRRLQRSISAQRLEDGSLLLQQHVVSPDGSRCAGAQSCTVQEGRRQWPRCNSLYLQPVERGPLQRLSCFQPAVAGAAHLQLPPKWSLADFQSSYHMLPLQAACLQPTCPANCLPGPWGSLEPTCMHPEAAQKAHSSIRPVGDLACCQQVHHDRVDSE